MKSKRCKPDPNGLKPNSCKNKVDAEFKKIMKDLDTQLRQNKNTNQGKSVSSSKPSLKTTVISKNKYQLND